MIASSPCTFSERDSTQSIRCRPARRVYDQHFRETASRFQLEAELFTQCRRKRKPITLWRVLNASFSHELGGVGRKRQLDVIGAFQAGLIDNRAPHKSVIPAHSPLPVSYQNQALSDPVASLSHGIHEATGSTPNRSATDDQLRQAEVHG